MTKNIEGSAYVDIGGFVHQDEGEVKTKLYVGDVNTPLKVDDAAITKRLKKVRVTMHVEEDTTPKNNVVYEKHVYMDQESSDEPDKKGATSSEKKVPVEEYDVEEPGKMDRVAVLKNFVDNVAEDVRGLNWKTLGIAVIAVAALVISIMVASR